MTCLGYYIKIVSRMTFLTSLENKYNVDQGLSVPGYRPLLREQGSKNQSALTLPQLFQTLSVPLDMTSHQSESYILYQCTLNLI